MSWNRWNRWYSFKSYISSALWIVPLIALLLFMVVSRITQPVGAWLLERGAFDQSSLLALSIAGARNLLEVAVTATLSFLVFTFGSLLVAIQVAGGQYTPRIIATTLLRDNAIRYTVGLFVFTLLFANRTLNQLDTTVDQFHLFLSASLGMLCIVSFLYLIDYAARLLRPVSLVARIAEQGMAVIESVYGAPAADTRPVPRRAGSEDRR